MASSTSSALSTSKAIIPYVVPQTPVEVIKSIVAPFVIFFDIDGVVNNSNEDVYKKVKELFPDKKGFCPSFDYDIAASYFFDRGAVKNLNYLIGEIEKTRRVQIVITSTWRKNRTVEQLREKIFGIHEFSKYIVDKTPEEISKQEIRANCPSEMHSDERRYQCTASGINFWLKQHPEVTSFIVLDDQDHHLAIAFGEKFFRTNISTLLTKEICQKILSQNNFIPSAL